MDDDQKKMVRDYAMYTKHMEMMNLRMTFRTDTRAKYSTMDGDMHIVMYRTEDTLILRLYGKRHDVHETLHTVNICCILVGDAYLLL